MPHYQCKSVFLVCLFMATTSLAAEPPASLAPAFNPPKEFLDSLGKHRSPLVFEDGSAVKTAQDWLKRKAEIKTIWHNLMGHWPPLIQHPKIEFLEHEKRGAVLETRIRIETAPGCFVDDAYLLKPTTGKGPFPAVIVVYYEAKTAVGRAKTEFRDYAIQLANRGYVTLSLGGDPNTYFPDKATCRIQPLSFHAYEAANCHTALANMPEVDPKRIGIVGHSYGGKWAMFAASLHDPFACGAWSDPGIVFDETKGNVNYWEPWYLGYDPALKDQRKRGIPDAKNPRTGPYKKMMTDGRDLTDLHALMAPRPFFVSGGSEDPPSRGDLHQINGLKNLLAACINGVSVGVFAWQGGIVWSLVPGMAAASVVGAYLAASFGKRLPKPVLRLFIITVGFVQTFYYLFRQAGILPGLNFVSP